VKQRLWRFVIDLVIVTLLLFGLRMSGYLEQSLLYFPERPLVATPQDFGLIGEEVNLTSADGEHLHGWYLPGEPGQPVLLFFHGNAGNISHRLDNLQRLHKHGLNLLIFDYRGYGQSTGTPSEAGLYRDADAALAWLHAQGWTQQRIIYFGRSLGAAIAVDLARRHPPAGLILETPFTSLRAMGRQHYPLLTALLGWVLRDRYDNLEKIGEVKAPLLMLHGDQDQIIPETMARQLFAAARDPKTFHLITGADHNDTYERGGDSYWQALTAFLHGLPVEVAVGKNNAVPLMGMTADSI
jgi:fermentation-respiration switch protein FrsA (DUF1100 family)